MNIALIPDGPSDQILIAPLLLLLKDIDPVRRYDITFVDLRTLRTPPKTLEGRLLFVLNRRDWDLVLVHRDAEKVPRERRVAEVSEAVDAARARLPSLDIDVVPVVPVRMTEAWLLIDEPAIRRAAGKTRSSVALKLPALSRIEKEPEPKDVLYEALRVASEKRGRRLEKFRPDSRRYRVAEHIDDWSPLDQLESFGALREALTPIVRSSKPRGVNT